MKKNLDITNLGIDVKPSVFFRLKTCRLLLRAVAGIFDFSWNKHTVEPLYNEVLGITNDFLYLSNSKVYEKEPRYNETSV